MHYIIYTLGICSVILNFAYASRNIILIITDDLDSELDGMIPLQKVNGLIGSEGIKFTNCFVASPICCPNRASILTGRYLHNHMVVNNSVEGNCYGQNWRDTAEHNTFATYLKNDLRYETFYAGKYMNQYDSGSPNSNTKVPPGWDHWYGLIGNSKYYDYTLSINGVRRKYGNRSIDYLTDVIADFSVNFIRSRRENDRPFLMVIAPPAPHEPFIPAMRHNDVYKNKKAKRTESFNQEPSDKHWLVQRGPFPLPRNVLPILDDAYRRRWESLLAVDELVSNVYKAAETNRLHENTYFIFTSDNGYHIGQFSMPLDKRQPYETDIKVPLLIRGPGISPGVVTNAVSSVDLFSTILQMAGTSQISDGTPLIIPKRPYERSVLVEYRGEKAGPNERTHCPGDQDPNLSHCSQDLDCKCEDAANNTFSCVRRIKLNPDDEIDDIFCIFDDDVKFVEAYNLKTDRDQIENANKNMKAGKRHKFLKRLDKLVNCKDQGCVLTSTIPKF